MLWNFQVAVVGKGGVDIDELGERFCFCAFGDAGAAEDEGDPGIELEVGMLIPASVVA